jgi:hypothetical protein
MRIGKNGQSGTKSEEGSFGRNLRMTTVAAAVVIVTGSGVMATQDVASQRGDAEVMVTANKFYCNVGALSGAERTRHAELARKLMERRQQIVEYEKGYEFQYSPKDVTVPEVAEWVVAESKCCPFFDFHIDLEEEGKLVCLRLTGAEGVKAFIRSEFGTQTK